MRATSYEEVVSGALLNTEQRFDAAIEQTHATLEEFRRQGKIIGGIVFGSAISKDASGNTDVEPLSDLDVIVITEDRHDNSFMRAMRQDSQDIFNQTAVTLEVGWLNETQAQGQQHSLLQPFHGWLRRQSEKYPEHTIGTPPAEIITPRQDDALPIVSSWLRSLINGHQKRGRSADAQLASVLSSPHVAARKSIDALRLADATGILDIPEPQSDCYTKGEMASMAKLVYSKDDLRFRELYDDLRLMKELFYGFIGAAATHGVVSRDSYDATIRDMANEATPKATRLLTMMKARFDHMSDSLPRDRESDENTRDGDKSWDIAARHYLQAGQLVPPPTRRVPVPTGKILVSDSW